MRRSLNLVITCSYCGKILTMIYEVYTSSVDLSDVAVCGCEFGDD